MKDNGFKLVKERSRRYPAQTITDDGYANDIALLVNSPIKAESLLYRAGRGEPCLQRKMMMMTVCQKKKKQFGFVIFNMCLEII